MDSKKAVLFDLDGVLVQTEQLKAQAHANTVKHFGGDVSPKFYCATMGHSQAFVQKEFIDASQIHISDAYYSATFDNIYAELLQEHLQLVEGSICFLRELKAKGYLTALVTSSKKWMLEIIFAGTKLNEYFDVIVTGEDVKNEKPAPDPYLYAMYALHVPASSCVVFEDSEAGIIAAARSGAQVIAIRHRYNCKQDLKSARQILDSFTPVEEILNIVEVCLL